MVYFTEDKIGGHNHAYNGDEFYTRYNDIERELANYDLKGMVVYCNCDNPKMSNFYKYFKDHFHDLGLKGLYASYYDTKPHMYYYDGSTEQSKRIQSGRFQDNASIMKMCDVVVTNPPFSNGMTRELLYMARKYGKHVIMVAGNTLSNKKGIRELITNNEFNIGYTPIGRFDRPDKTVKSAPTAWYTTFKKKGGDFFYSGLKYSPSKYPKYDNYNAIECPKYEYIPDDYNGMIGVPLGFLRILNRDQFNVIDIIRPRLNGMNKNDRVIIQRKHNNNMTENITNKVYSNFMRLLYETELNRTAEDEETVTPNVELLTQLYDQFNNEYWGGQLPSVKITLSGRATRSIGRAAYHLCAPVLESDGLWHSRLDAIEGIIFTSHFSMAKWALCNTLIHEMIHIADYAFNPENYHLVYYNKRWVNANTLKKYDAHGEDFFIPEAERLKQYGWNITKYVTKDKLATYMVSDRIKQGRKKRKETANRKKTQTEGYIRNFYDTAEEFSQKSAVLNKIFDRYTEHYTKQIPPKVLHLGDLTIKINFDNNIYQYSIRAYVTGVKEVSISIPEDKLNKLEDLNYLYLLSWFDSQRESEIWDLEDSVY